MSLHAHLRFSPRIKIVAKFLNNLRLTEQKQLDIAQNEKLKTMWSFLVNYMFK